MVNPWPLQPTGNSNTNRLLPCHQQCSVSGITAWTKAALGEYVPAKPPDSFQAATYGDPPAGVTWMPMSWLKPALRFQRSAFPPIAAWAAPS